MKVVFAGSTQDGRFDMESLVDELQEFDLRTSLPGQTLVVKTHGDVELVVQIPPHARVIMMGNRPCLSELVVRQRSVFTPQLQCTYPSLVIRTGESWQYGQHLHSHDVISIELHPTRAPFTYGF